ncbi:MAG: hypothetical protein GY714_15040 [Desulfobacterales bacterium]|nr:hypothetical protein [Desulfobacterales bacterium]
MENSYNDSTQEDISVSEKLDIKNSNYVEVPESVRRAVDDAMYLVHYVADKGLIAINKNSLNNIIHSKYLIEQNRWTPEDEVNFWITYDEVATQIDPVTIRSLKSIIPGLDSKGRVKKKTKASSAVRRYMMLTIFFMLILLVAQIYWVIGSDLHTRLGEIFEKRNQNQLNYDRMRGGKTEADIKSDVHIEETRAKLEILNQQLDSNYELLCSWNSIWNIVLFRGQPFEGKLTRYVELKNNQKISELEHKLVSIDRKWLDYLIEMKKKKQESYRKRIKNGENKISSSKEPDLNTIAANISLEIEGLKEFSKKVWLDKGDNLEEIESKNPKALLLAIKLEELKNELDIARNRMFLNDQSAGFVLRTFHVYFLPLLYGLLGAATFVLRTLSREIKTLTYSRDSESKFILRLSLGALGGMSIGWFMKPESLSMSGSFSSMTLSFLVGYNIDILFSVMDRVVKGISEQIKGEKKVAAVE